MKKSAQLWILLKAATAAEDIAFQLYQAAPFGESNDLCRLWQQQRETIAAIRTEWLKASAAEREELAAQIAAQVETADQVVA